jgi:hypothetical protein
MCRSGTAGSLHSTALRTSSRETNPMLTSRPRGTAAACRAVLAAVGVAVAAAIGAG